MIPTVIKDVRLESGMDGFLEHKYIAIPTGN